MEINEKRGYPPLNATKLFSFLFYPRVPPALIDYLTLLISPFTKRKEVEGDNDILYKSFSRNRHVLVTTRSMMNNTTKTRK